MPTIAATYPSITRSDTALRGKNYFRRVRPNSGTNVDVGGWSSGNCARRNFFHVKPERQARTAGRRPHTRPAKPAARSRRTARRSGQSEAGSADAATRSGRTTGRPQRKVRPAPARRQEVTRRRIPPQRVGFFSFNNDRQMGKGILLWLIGVPIPVIRVLWLIFH